MAAIKQIWDWNSYSGGEGDGFYKGPEGSYRAGTNIDSRTFDFGLKLATKVTSTGEIYSGDILSVDPYGPNAFATELSGIGKAYYNGLYKFDINTGTAAYNQIYGWGKMTRVSDTTTYSYAFTATNGGVGQIHRFNPGYSGATTGIATRILGNGRTSSPTLFKLPTISEPGRIIFAWGNSLFEIDDTETVTRLVYFPKEVDIIGITPYLDTYKIYYNWERYSSGDIDGYIAYWDGSSENISEYVKYENSPIRLVVNNGPSEYVIFGTSPATSDLYLVQGLQRSELRINVENSVGNTRQLGTEGGIREGILYLTGQDKLGNAGLYSFGNFYRGQNVTLVPEYGGKTISKINVKGSNMYIYVNDDSGTNVGGIYTKSFQFGEQTEASGAVYSYPLTGRDIRTKKKLEEIYVMAENFNTSDTVKIYARVNKGPYDDNTGWTLIKNITGYTGKRETQILSYEISSLGLGDWYQLEYKVELTANSTRSPILYSIITIYIDDVER